ncbi:MAG TPA: TonB-dependent receptor [Thermoanaerobaculia bacterium]|nr:TonB-dependent receptor [Thermoanaerobaculia bacterium]
MKIFLLTTLALLLVAPPAGGALLVPMYEQPGDDALPLPEAAESSLPHGKTEEITVTASRLGSGAAGQAAVTTVIPAEEILASPAAALDDVLRQVPGFSLFRRSGSRNANPTAQGVSLRGIGPSGASRTIVLDDGIPLNDPFGGWVNWGRVPLAAIDGLEVVRGGTSDLHGSGALSGVIQILRRRNPGAVIRLFSGDGETAGISAAASFPYGPYTLTLDGEHFQTKGHIPIAPEHRGAVDRPAGVERTVADASLSRDWSQNARAFIRLGGLTEARENGTALQTNATTLSQLAVGFDRTIGSDRLSFRGFGLEQDYEQTFSAVLAGRNEERLTRLQEVPSSSHGLSAHWLRDLGDGRAFVAGAEFKRVEGRSDEWVPGSDTIASSNGGAQRMASLFGETLFAPLPDTSLVLSARWDRWENHGGPARDPGMSQRRVESAFSLRAAVVRKLDDRWTATASAYRSFRAPTLNELYRSFRVGNVVTAANPELEAEGVVGIEGGVRFTGERLDTRINLFRMELEDPVANVTLSATPDLVNRRRENLGRTLTKGVEADVDLKISPVWSLSAGYLYADARVVSFPEEPTIEGRRLPHVAPHTISSSLRYDDKVSSGTINLRWSDEAFEDERNSMVLNDYFAVDVFASRRIHRIVHAFAGVENLTDERIEVGMTPLPTLGARRTWRFGFDLR